MVWDVLDVAKNVISPSNQIENDDFSDRLSRRCSVAVLLAFRALVVSTHYVGPSPIACWAPAEYTKAMADYANNICWISNTYYVPMDDRLPAPGRARQRMISYYQWVPFILSTMAFFFYVPFVTWRFCSKSSSLNSKTIMGVK